MISAINEHVCTLGMLGHLNMQECCHGAASQKPCGPGICGCAAVLVQASQTCLKWTSHNRKTNKAWTEPPCLLHPSRDHTAFQHPSHPRNSENSEAQKVLGGCLASPADSRANKKGQAVSLRPRPGQPSPCSDQGFPGRRRRVSSPAGQETFQ